MTVQVIVNMTIRDGAYDAYVDYMKETLQETRAADGAVCMELWTDQDDPHHAVIMEKWNSRDQYEAYSRHRVDVGGMERVATIFDGAPRISILDPTGV